MDETSSLPRNPTVDNTQSADISDWLEDVAPSRTKSPQAKAPGGDRDDTGLRDWFEDVQPIRQGRKPAGAPLLKDSSKGKHAHQLEDNTLSDWLEDRFDHPKPVRRDTPRHHNDYNISQSLTGGHRDNSQKQIPGSGNLIDLEEPVMTSLASDGKQNKLKIDSFDSTKSLTGDLSDGDRAGATPLLLIDVGDDASRSSQPENSDDDGPFDRLGPLTNSSVDMMQHSASPKSDSDDHEVAEIPSIRSLSMDHALPTRSILAEQRPVGSPTTHTRRVTFHIPQEEISDIKPRNFALYRYGSKGSTQYTSMSELRDVYIKKCDALALAPLPELMRQIDMAIEHDTQVRTLILRDMDIKSDEWEALGDFITSNGFLAAVILVNAGLTDKALTRIVAGLCKFKAMEVLNISRNTLLNTPGLIQLNTLLTTCRRIRELDLSGIHFDRRAASSIARALPSSPLTKLVLNNCGFSDPGLLELLVHGISRSTALKILQVQSNKIAEPSMRVLATMLANGQCGLSTLDLRSNELSDSGARVLAEALCQNKNLRKVVLWRNRIRARGLQCLAQSLRHNSVLATLDVSYNDCAGSEAMTELKNSLLANSVLTNISLAFTGCTGEGIIALCEALAVNRTVEHLDIRHNCLDTAGLMALSRTCEHSEVLSRVLVDSDASDELTTELLQKIHESCERKSHARTLDKRHPGAKVADRSRFSENDPHRLRASIHLEKEASFPVEEARSKVVQLSETLEYFNPESDSLNSESLHGQLNDILSLQPQLQFRIETENDLAVLEQLLALNDDINKLLHRYDILDEQINPRPVSSETVQPLGPGGFPQGTPQALAAAAQETMAAAATRLTSVLSDSWGLFKKPTDGQTQQMTSQGAQGQVLVPDDADPTKKFVAGVENMFASLSAQMQGLGISNLQPQAPGPGQDKTGSSGDRKSSVNEFFSGLQTPPGISRRW